jgi:hypothetical protein
MDLLSSPTLHSQVYLGRKQMFPAYYAGWGDLEVHGPTGQKADAPSAPQGQSPPLPTPSEPAGTQNEGEDARASPA